MYVLDLIVKAVMPRALLYGLVWGAMTAFEIHTLRTCYLWTVVRPQWVHFAKHLQKVHCFASPVAISFEMWHIPFNDGILFMMDTFIAITGEFQSIEISRQSTSLKSTKWDICWTELMDSDTIWRFLLVEHRARYCLIVWWREAITRPNVDSSSICSSVTHQDTSAGIHPWCQ